MVVQYKYDAFGKVLEKTIEETELAQTLAEENIFLYKGYCYDNETGLYYLTTRYYNPEWGRFISPDSIDYLDPESINGLNLYAYCGNDPVNKYDPTGHFSLPNWAKWVIGGVAFAGAVALTIVSGGTLAPVFIGMGASILGGGLIQGSINAFNGGNFWNGFADGAADGALWGGIFALAGASINAIRYTRGFRVVNMNEFGDISKTGKFASNGFSEGKYFWRTKSSAKIFASKEYAAGEFRIVGARVSRFGLNKAVKNGSAYLLPNLDIIGDAFFVEIDAVSSIVSKIWTVI